MILFTMNISSYLIWPIAVAVPGISGHLPNVRPNENCMNVKEIGSKSVGGGVPGALLISATTLRDY